MEFTCLQHYIKSDLKLILLLQQNFFVLKFAHYYTLMLNDSTKCRYVLIKMYITKL